MLIFAFKSIKQQAELKTNWRLERTTRQEKRGEMESGIMVDMRESGQKWLLNRWRKSNQCDWDEDEAGGIIRCQVIDTEEIWEL